MLLWALSLLLCANPGGQAQKRRYSPGNQVLPPAVPPVPQQFPIPGPAAWNGGWGPNGGELSGVSGMEWGHPRVF